MQLCSKMYSDPCQTDKKEIFAKLVKNLQPSNIFGKNSILDAWKGSEHVFLFFCITNTGFNMF